MNRTESSSYQQRTHAQAAFAAAMRDGAKLGGRYQVQAFDTGDLMRKLARLDATFNKRVERGLTDGLTEGLKLGLIKDPSELLMWEDEVLNTVVNTGLDDYLTNMWKASAYTAQHYVGLTDGTPTVAAADTMASHAGWTEPTGYSQATRPDLTAGLGTTASQSLATSSSRVFSINATITAGGAFSTTNNTKGGSTGTLITAGAFTQGDRSLSNGDTLNVDLTFTAS